MRRTLGQWRNKRIALLLPDEAGSNSITWRMRLCAGPNPAQQVARARSATASEGQVFLSSAVPRMPPATAGTWIPCCRWSTCAPEVVLLEPPPWRRSGEVGRIARRQRSTRARQRRIKAMAYRRPAPAWVRWAGNLLGSLMVAVLAGFTFLCCPPRRSPSRPGRSRCQSDLAMNAVAGIDAATSTKATAGA